MIHHIIFVLKDVADSTQLKSFLANFVEEHYALVAHFRKNGLPQMGELVDCEEQLVIAVIAGSLTLDSLSFNVMKGWCQTNFDNAVKTVNIMFHVLKTYSENVNQNLLIQHSFQTSNVIHQLLDKMNMPDFSRLHIVIDETIIPYWPLGTSGGMLMSTFARAVYWNGASFYPLSGEEGREPMRDWFGTFPLVRVITPKDRAFISARFPKDNSLHFAVDVPEEDCSASSMHSCLGTPTRWVNNIEVVRILCLQSIPIHYFITNVKLRILDPQALLPYNLGTRKCLLLRACGFDGTINPKVGDPSRMYEEWQTTIRGDTVRVPRLLTKPNRALHFILTGEGRLFPLVRDVCMDFLVNFQPFLPLPLPRFKTLPLLTEITEATLPDPYNYLGDATEWPERNYLIESSGDQIAALTSSRVISLTAPNIVSLFDLKTGLPATVPEVLEPLIWQSLSMQPTIDIEVAKVTAWPEILKHTCHDYYYNRSQEDEIWEMTCSRWREGALRNPTSTSLEPGNKPACVVRHKAFDILPQARDELNDAAHWKRAPRKARNAKRNTDCRTSQQLLRRNPFRDILREVSNDSPTSPGRTTPASTSTKRTRSPREAPEEPQNPAKRLRISAVANEKLKRKLREAVATALEEQGINMEHELFKTCGKKLFTICRTFAVDLIGSGRTSEILLRIAKSNAKQVIDFERSVKGETN